MSEYDDWGLELLRKECADRENVINTKDGVKTLAARLRASDKAVEKVQTEDETVELETDRGVFESSKTRTTKTVEDPGNFSSDHDYGNKGKIPSGPTSYERTREPLGSLSFDERLRLLQFERDMAVERDELEMRREERKRRAEREDKAFEVELERERYQFSVAKQRVPKPIKVREMRENEDIDDYFRIFEMTAKAQLISQDEWLGSLIPRLSEKAKSIYLEIVGPDAQDYNKSKAIILRAYQLNVDHYRYRFRHSEKKAGEDFGQWAHRTRRYLNRWMTVAEAIDNREKILEQIVIERLLDGVGPELQVWLKEKKPNTAEELANLANDYVQSRKGPLIDGKYVSVKRNDNKPRKDDFCKMRDKVYENNKGNPDKPDFGKFRDKFDKSKVKCFNCQEKGHYAHECRKKKNQNAALLGMTKGYNTLGSYIVGNLNGNKVQMIIDSGCSRTLVHENLVSKNSFTGENITVITANGDRVEVPLAWVTINSEQGIHRELVGVMRNFPVDCLLGRSSYGKSLAKKNLLDHWEQAVDLNIEPTVVYSDKNKSALVVTRRQAALVKAQTRLDKLTDKQNELAIKTLSPKEPAKDELSETIELNNLFGEDNNVITDPDPEKVCVKEPVADIDSSENGCQLETNILDRSHSQLINDQKKDVTLHNLTILNVPPEDTDGYFYLNVLLCIEKLQNTRMMDCPLLTGLWPQKHIGQKY